MGGGDRSGGVKLVHQVGWELLINKVRGKVAFQTMSVIYSLRWMLFIRRRGNLLSGEVGITYQGV